jgi:hypothetical protein
MGQAQSWYREHKECMKNYGKTTSRKISTWKTDTELRGYHSDGSCERKL